MNTKIKITLRPTNDGITDARYKITKLVNAVSVEAVGTRTQIPQRPSRH